MNKTNREVQRFVDLVGGNTKAARILGCSPDMVRKIKTGDRNFSPKYVRTMYKHKGFRLSFLRLFDLD
jgi:DNA-binding transcriptional regulator YdaS (Cro superfamily)